MDNNLNWKEITQRLFLLYFSKTQEELGKILGVSQDLISKWVRGRARPNWDLIARTVNEHKISWEWLMTGKTSNVNELVRIYSSLPETEIVDNEAYMVAQATLTQTVHNKYCDMKYGLSIPPLKNYTEIANRLYFAAKNRTPLDFSEHFYSDVDCTEYWGGDTTLRILQDCGYSTNFSFAYTALDSIFRDYQSEPIESTKEWRQRIDNAESKWAPTKFPNMYEKNWRKVPNAGSILPGSQRQNSSFPIRGLAAADESGGSRVPDTDEVEDTITLPNGLTFVPIQGDSMSPVILNGQYAVIDSEREGFEVDGGIVVASILEPNAADDQKEPMTGTFVKRCYKGDGIYYFTSVNEYSPFSALIRNCRIWPVIGTWFADKGRVPKDFG